MKKHRIIFYSIFLFLIILIVMQCISISSGFGSFPWWVGIVYPACYISLPLFFYSLYLFYKYHYLKEFIFMMIIVSIQFLMLFV